MVSLLPFCWANHQTKPGFNEQARSLQIPHIVTDGIVLHTRIYQQSRALDFPSSIAF